jgi:pimeloyl-ACP methyl ester carboxylesterase
VSESEVPATTGSVAGYSGPVEVVVQGDGPTVMVIHGGSGDVTSWAPVAELLADRYRVVRFTRPTYRLDPPPRGAEAAAAEVGDARAVAHWAAAQNGDAPLILVGHSSGAVVALETALADPGPFRALVLYEPPLDVTHSPGGTEILERAMAALDEGDPVGAMRIHLTEFVGMPSEVVSQWLDYPAARDVFAGFAAGQIADNEMLHSLPVGPARFHAITLPVLLITGENSPAHLHKRSDDLAAALPGTPARVTLTGQGHGANREDPTQLAAAIAAFAAELD